mmetsp:Transcript_86257/g.244480  ORF Transcript_86257/g.244480 Transcript_86257/m.244480 type:complete len:259 (+) Transcript_86257:431-1207(+)
MVLEQWNVGSNPSTKPIFSSLPPKRPRPKSVFLLHCALTSMRLRLGPTWPSKFCSFPTVSADGSSTAQLSSTGRSPRLNSALTPSASSITPSSISSDDFVFVVSLYGSDSFRTSLIRGLAASIICLAPPGQSSSSVAPMIGRRSRTECRFLPSSEALWSAIDAWRTWSSGEVGKRDVTMLLKSATPAADAFCEDMRSGCGEALLLLRESPWATEFASSGGVGNAETVIKSDTRASASAASREAAAISRRQGRATAAGQ